MPARTRNQRNTNQTEDDQNKENSEMTEQQTVQDPEVDETESADEPAEVDEAVAEQPEVEAAETKPVPVSPMTPYQATKRVNEALAKALEGTGHEKTVRSPMLYIYAGKGAFNIHPAVKVGKNGKETTVHEIDEESFLLWMADYVRGAVERVTGAKDEATEVAEGEEASGITTDEVEQEQDSTPAEAE
jgi:hypothetical protein